MLFAFVFQFSMLIIGLQSKESSRKCCSIGRNVAINSWKSFLSHLIKSSDLCSQKSINTHLKESKINILKSSKCLIIAQSCCMKILKKDICNLGASQTESCETTLMKLPSMMNQIKTECCLCCQGGSLDSLLELDSCSLLNGMCPEKLKQDTLTNVSLSTKTSSPTIMTTSMNIPKAKYSTTASSTDTNFMKEVNSPKRNVTNEIQISDNKFNNSLTEPNVTDSTKFPGDNKMSSNISERSGTTELADAVISNSDYSNFYDKKLNYSTLKAGNITTKPITRNPTFNLYGVYQTSNSPIIICENGRKWDPQLQACVQLIIFCPKKFILHPNNNRCVPIIQPKIPCKLGYQYNQFKEECFDINECEMKNQCKNDEICTNIVGSFICNCKAGFKRNKDGSCEDFDECSNMDICSGEQKCKNTVGSYKCVRSIPCGFGWIEDPATSDCMDVNECESFPGICGTGMKCVNIRGSHQCEDDECPKNMKRNNRGICSHCQDGFQLNNVTNKCEDIDECTALGEWYNGPCKDSDVCFNLAGSYECIPKKKCKQGTILTKNGTECEDIDECIQMKFRCETDQICVNTFSSYQCRSSTCAPSEQYDYIIKKCVCREGFRSNEDNTCSDIDECQENSVDSLCGSMYMCINHPGSYSCIHKADCPSGMFRSSTYSSCQDIDECETGEGKCSINMHCVNIVGSYKCMCNRGYVMGENNTCTDVNECLLFRPEESCPDLEARCVNTPGSYKCQCPKGFQWSDYPIKKCTDINECQVKNPCGVKHECINTLGSYKCKCFKGYRLSISGDFCEDIDECMLELKKCVNSLCINLPGRYTCKCPQGFTLDNKEICQDIDECSTFEKMCSKDEVGPTSTACINLYGYFKCVNNSCPTQYSKKDTGNGFICKLKKIYSCKLSDSNCLLERPYQKMYEFIEISSPIESRRTLSRLNIAHLPPGVNKINLQVKYARNTDTRQEISVKNIFQLITDRYNRDNIELVMLRSVSAPAEIQLYLEVNRYHQQMYFGHSHAYIHIYFTKYPAIIT